MDPVQEKIKPCEMDKPYVFVSYSRSDQEVVWKDVLALQQKGYNIWLDVNNLSTTNSSWTVDAKNAIQNSLCRHILFYVSSHSLCSEPCLRELYEASSLETCMKHSDWNGIGITAIDAENIPKISELIENIAQSIPGERDIRRFALEGITAKVFPEGDARNRILYQERDSTGRCGEKIQTALPDETKCCMAQPDLDAARKVPRELSVTLLQADQGDYTAMEQLVDYFYGQEDWPSTRFWIDKRLTEYRTNSFHGWDDSYESCQWRYLYSWCCWQIDKDNGSWQDWKKARNRAQSALDALKSLLNKGIDVRQQYKNTETILNEWKDYFTSQYESLLKQANDGDVVAQYNIARWLFNYSKDGDKLNDVGKKARKDAVEWLEKAAAQNYSPAIYELARCYESDGRGKSPDPVKSVDLMRQAAEAGCAPAQFYLAYYYSFGKGDLKEDLEQAAAWCRQAAEAGYAPAQFFLARDYSTGKEDLKKDLNQAIKHLWEPEASDL